MPLARRGRQPASSGLLASSLLGLDVRVSPASQRCLLTDPRVRLEAALSERYQVERELGQGGMATVYLARDLRHERRVAVKVLRPELAAVIGAERFLQEIKLTANLQHAHILPLHDSGAVDGVLYYVMPYVEGETLRARLTREKQLEIAEAVEFAKQVASALDYAHRRGIIHRDIKPENVLLHDRQALVADFGIALAVSMAGGNTRMTETGMSLGTPQYMSPEQAMGDRELDARSDIYSLGAMLYEMLAGDPPYTGSTAQAIVAKVITEKAPPVTALRETVPPNVAAALQKALAKLPADRFHSAADFAEALSNPTFSTPLPTQALGVPVATRGWKRWIWPAVAAGFAALAAGALLRPARRTAAPVARYALLFPGTQAPVTRPWTTLGLAPDGSWLAYVGPPAAPAQGQDQLWIKRRDRHEATPLPGTVDGWSPVGSPDGQWVAFAVPSQGGQLQKVPVVGGSPITLADSLSNNNVSALAWGDDEVITYIDRRFGLRRVNSSGGASAVVWSPPTGRFAGLPTALPKGRGVLFLFCDQACRGVLELWVLDLKSGQAKSLLPGAVRGWYVASGHLIYVRRDGAAFAAPFDLGSLTVTGAAIPVLDGIRIPGIVPQLALSPAGTVGYFSGGATGQQVAEAVWVTRDGKTTPVDTTWEFDPSANAGWSLSPDGKRLAIKLNTEAGQHIWVKQLDAGPRSRLTFDSAPHVRPHWLPDGRTVSYVSARGQPPQQNLYVRRGDGTGPESLKVKLDRDIWEAAWSRDGKWLVLRTGGVAGTTGERDVYVMQLGVDSAPRPLLASQADEKAIALSPDGRWLAYESNETGRDEVHVRPFPNVDDGKWQVSINGGVLPLWAHNGKELFYRDEANQMLTSAQVTSTGSFDVTSRRPLFKLGLELILSVNYTPFDVSPDDQRFLMTRVRQAAQVAGPPPLILIENWFEELKAKTRQ